MIGRDRIEVTKILSDSIHGPAESGDAVRREMRVALENGEQLRLLRVLPDGDWRVVRLQ
jgi:hypothetical protein